MNNPQIDGTKALKRVLFPVAVKEYSVSAKIVAASPFLRTMLWFTKTDPSVTMIISKEKLYLLTKLEISMMTMTSVQFSSVRVR